MNKFVVLFALILGLFVVGWTATSAEYLTIKEYPQFNNKTGFTQTLMIRLENDLRSLYAR